MSKNSNDFQALKLLTGVPENRPGYLHIPVRNYLLGDGFAAWLYYQEMDPDLDPLDPASALYIFNGVLTGSFGTTASRTHPMRVAAKAARYERGLPYLMPKAMPATMPNAAS